MSSLHLLNPFSKRKHTKSEDGVPREKNEYEIYIRGALGDAVPQKDDKKRNDSRETVIQAAISSSYEVYERVINQNEALRAKIDFQDRACDQEKSKHRETRWQLRLALDDCERLKKEEATLQRQHKNDLTRITRQHQNERDGIEAKFNRWHDGVVTDLKKDYEHTIKQLSQTHKMEVQELQESRRRFDTWHEGVVRDMDAQHSGAVAQLNEAHELKFAELRDTHMREAQRFEDEKVQAQRSHEADLAKLKSVCRQREQTLVSRHQEETRQLSSDLQELNVAMLERDDTAYQGSLFTASGLPQKPDDKIRDQFLEIRQLVDDLAKQHWRPEQQAWSTMAFEQIGQHNPRLVKKAILQDMIWSKLCRALFCSPFRMFGEAGNRLEQEWTTQCGKGETSNEEVYTWPDPGVKAERWRYFTTKECREALMKPVPSHMDPRAGIKKGFNQSRQAVLSELKETLGEMVDLTSEDIQTIDRLVKKSSLMWLEFTMHRRLIVILLKGSHTVTTVSRLKEGSITLTTQPLVGRYGNVSGLELDHFTEINGCEGDYIELP